MELNINNINGDLNEFKNRIDLNLLNNNNNSLNSDQFVKINDFFTLKNSEIQPINIHVGDLNLELN